MLSQPVGDLRDYLGDLGVVCGHARTSYMGLFVFHSQPYKGVPGSTWESHDDQEEQGEVTKPIGAPNKSFIRWSFWPSLWNSLMGSTCKETKDLYSMQGSLELPAFDI